MRAMKLVLDATALRSGMQLSGEFDWITAPSIISEIERGKQGRDVTLLTDISIRVLEPGEKALATVSACAEKTSDTGRLSRADLDVLALAYEHKAIILTDDYSIQNVARILKIEYMTGGERGIRKIIHWTWRCKGCGRFFNAEPDGKECPVCGSEVRTVPKKK